MKDIQKTVGIVTPAHNSEATIAATLKSISEQTYPYFKVFVVNDHSSDNTAKIVENIAQKDSRFVLINLENSTGAAAARNKAIEAAHEAGVSYIAFLDGDDLWDKKKLETEVSFMEKTGTTFSYGDYKIAYPDGAIKKYRKSPKKMSYTRMLLGCSVGCLTVMYDANKVGKISIPNLKKRNDYAIWCIILKRVKKGLKYPGLLATYNRSSSSLSSGKKTQLIKHHYRMHRQVNGFSPLVAGFFTFTNAINYLFNISFGEKHIK